MASEHMVCDIENPLPAASNPYIQCRTGSENLGQVPSTPFSRVSSTNSSSYHWWRLLERSSSQALPPPTEQENSLSPFTSLALRIRTKCRVFAQLVSWNNFLFFALCWLVLGVAACVTIYNWAKSVETSRQDNALHVATELANFLGTEIERFIVPLYPLRVFVQETSLIQLSHIASSFPPAAGAPDQYKNISNLSQYPEIQVEFDEAMEGIWGSLDDASRSSTLSIQLSPRGIVTMVSPPEGNEDVLGLNILDDAPDVVAAAQSAIAANGPSVVGPVHLVQGGVGLLAYLPVFVDEGVQGAMATKEMAGVGREVVPGGAFWGFTTAVANLTKMAEWSGALRDFEHANMHFEMSRRGREGGDGGGAAMNHRLLENDNGFSVVVEVPRLQWELSVGWNDGFWPLWFGGVCAVAVAGAGTMAALVTCVLMSRQKHRLLLYRIMPPNVVKSLHQGRQVVQHFENVTVFFSDLVGFTNLSSRSSALEVVAMLNELYTEFDRIALKHQVFKSDTIGDAYMVVGGAPAECDPEEAAARVARFALEALDLIEEADLGLSMRAGMASGPAVAAVLGTTMPKYAFFGETVNVANVMESSGKPGALQVTSATHQLLLRAVSSSNSSSSLPVGSGPLALRMTEVERSAARTGSAAGPTFWVQRDGSLKRQRQRSLRRHASTTPSPLQVPTARNGARASDHSLSADAGPGNNLNGAAAVTGDATGSGRGGDRARPPALEIV